MNADTWVLIGLFAWIGVCVIVNAVLQRGKRIRDLQETVREERGYRKLAEQETASMRHRIDVTERHVVLIRDHRISELEEENKRLTTECRAYKKAMESMEELMHKREAAEA